VFLNHQYPDFSFQESISLCMALEVQIAYDRARVEKTVATIYEAEHSYAMVTLEFLSQNDLLTGQAYSETEFSLSHSASLTHVEPLFSKIDLIFVSNNGSSGVPV